MSRVSHGACGRTWKQKGDKSGHCSGCHVTFYGITAFDRHQETAPDGRTICLDPAAGDCGPWWQDEDDQWHHGQRMTEEQKRERGWIK